MKATIETLEKELENYEKRVNFLTQYIKHLTEHTTNMNGDLVYRSLDDVDKAYRLENELDFKKFLIHQRKGQIKQINEQEELKVKALEQMPELIEGSKVVYNNMLDSLDKLNKAPKKTKEIKDAIKMIEIQSDEVSELIDGIEERFNNSDKDSVLNDFRQLNNILRIEG